MNLATLPVVIIPALEPGPGLPEMARQLLTSGAIQSIVVVDDGSSPRFAANFEDLRRIEGVHVLEHAVNLGKGAALKTGLNYAACTFAKSLGMVTADADGQHLTGDILAVVKAFCENPDSLVIGVRSLGRNAPLRSRFGNKVTRYIMLAVTGQRITDTQTGLRGIPMDFVPELLRLKATGYEFELDLLVQCKIHNRPILEVPIAAIYIDENRSSHFDPLWDSMRIYFVFVRFAAVSLMTAVIDNLVFIAALRFSSELALCQIAARLVAGSFNYYLNKRGVFHSQARNAIAFPRYWLVVLMGGLLSYALIQSILRFTSLSVIPAKLVAETIMFFFSFVVQRDFVFSARPIRRDE